MDNTILEDQITKYRAMIADRDKKIDFLKVQQKEDQNILKQMEKSLQRLKDANVEEG